MKFNIYDILSKIIPGGIIYAVVYFFLKDELNDFSEVIALILMYVIGYLIEVLASSTERGVLFRTFGGNPALKLLEGKKFIHIRLNQLDKINQVIERLFQHDQTDKLNVFLTMYSQVNKKDYTRIKEFLEAYVFARNLLISLLLSAIYVNIKSFSYLGLSISIVILLIAWIRVKQRNYYFSKEVIETFYEEEKNV